MQTRINTFTKLEISTNWEISFFPLCAYASSLAQILLFVSVFFTCKNKQKERFVRQGEQVRERKERQKQRENKPYHLRVYSRVLVISKPGKKVFGLRVVGLSGKPNVFFCPFCTLLCGLSVGPMCKFAICTNNS